MLGKQLIQTNSVKPDTFRKTLQIMEPSDNLQSFSKMLLNFYDT